MKSTAASTSTPVHLPAIPVQQGQHVFYLFTMPASKLYRLLEINRRSEDKREGYQRALSPSRVKSVERYIVAGRRVPGAIIAAFDRGSFDPDARILTLPKDENVGWVVDGQHRLAGAFQASEEGSDIWLPAVGLLEASLQDQIELFITINREARGVPASLYIDLLKDLPRVKSEREIIDERVSDIARQLNNEELSPFFQRVIFTRTARAGEISLVNFARIFRSLLDRTSGILGIYTEIEQEGAITNYYKALSIAYPEAWRRDIFFRTVGFGGVWRAFPLVFTLTNSRFKGFTVSAIAKIFSQVGDFDFESWNQFGTGSAAEIQAGNDLISRIRDAFSSEDSPSVVLKLSEDDT
jgi:DGQHR domain-containing protein